MRFKIILLTMIFGALILSSCKSSNNSSCTGSSCTSSSTGSSPSASSLPLTFSDSYYFDTNGDEWKTIDTAHLNAGDLGTILLYSDVISTSLSDAKTAIKNADTQYSLGSSIAVSARSKIPYFKINTKNNAVVNIEYKRYDSSNNIQAQVKTNQIATNGSILLPLVNEQFSNQMYISTVGTASASSYTHQISVYASANDSNPSLLKVIKFKIKAIDPLKYISISYSTDAQNFNLKNRWNYYFNGVDYTPNNSFKLGDLVDASGVASSIPLDVRFVFKQPPTLKINQTIFSEETIDNVLYNTTGVISPRRGTKYIQKTIQLDSDNHFKAKFSINDSEVSLTGGTTVEYRDIPAGEKWRFGFIYDFNKNATYSSSQNLLSPLKPMCSLIRKQSFYPISDANSKTSVTNAGGFYATCHPTTNNVLNIGASGLASNLYSLLDTFNDFFSYRKAQSITTQTNYEEYDAGHFYGIRDLEFTVSGCVKIYTREASALEVNPNTWQQKNVPSDECGTGDFTYFELSKKDDIFNHLNDYITATDLAQVISALGSSTTTDRTNWFFNGSSYYYVIY